MPGYLLDTNFISETRKIRADAGVMAFLADLGFETIVAQLVPTSRNAPARQFLDSLGFCPAVRTEVDLSTAIRAAS